MMFPTGTPEGDLAERLREIEQFLRLSGCSFTYLQLAFGTPTIVQPERDYSPDYLRVQPQGNRFPWGQAEPIALIGFYVELKRGTHYSLEIKCNGGNLPRLAAHRRKS
jgi:hypothetical protein